MDVVRFVIDKKVQDGLLFWPEGEDDIQKGYAHNDDELIILGLRSGRYIHS